MSPKAVDVIIPVYKDHAATRSCILSVLSARNDIHANVLVVNDASPCADIASLLAALQAEGRIRLVTNARNRGFVQAVNQGIAAGGVNDVVLLNSDTLVFSRWLDRLNAAASSSHSIGTATPFSNNATICSYPMPDTDNPFDARLPNQTLAEIFLAVNAGEIRDIPTGVGFCLYVRRACLDDVGPFDEHGFGKGYGEENDFCRRAAQLGWRNVLAADVFVPHRGGVSFADARKPALQRSLAVLNARFPGYGKQIERFCATDPLLALRRAVDARILTSRESPPLALRVCHDRGGGTGRRLRDEALELARQGVRVATLLPVADAPRGRVRLHIEDAPECVNLAYDLPQELGLLLELLEQLNARVALYHHFIDLDPCVLEIPRLLGIPCDVIVHDFGWYCPGINLLDGNDSYCGEPGVLACKTCPSALADCSSSFSGVQEYLETTSAFLAQSMNIIAPSQDTAQRYSRRTGAGNITVRPHSSHPVQCDAMVQGGNASARLRVAVFGSIGKHKGYDVLLRCARDAHARDLPMDFVVIGNTMDDFQLFCTGRVFVTGEYDEQELVHLLSLHAPHVAFYPSVWPETWCFTLDIAFRFNIHPVAFSIGAPGERIRLSGFGSLLPVDSSAAAINDALLEAGRRLHPDCGHGSGDERGLRP